MSTTLATPDDSVFSMSSSPASSISSISDASLPELTDALISHLISRIDLDDIQDVLISIAYAAGEMMLEADPSVDTSLTKKNTSDRVTATDRAIENMVKARLSRQYPDFEFLGEETFREGQKLTDEPTFICDPIDGTLNFIHGFPNTAISLALTVGKKPVIGVVYNPFRRDLFTAIKGRGAFLTRNADTNRSSRVQLPVRSVPQPLNTLNECLCAIEWGSERTGPNWELRSSVSQRLLTSKVDGGAMVHSVRSSGSAALSMCYTAAGWFDLFWEGGCWVWDVAAGWLICEEAGGIVVGANPGEWDATIEGRSYFAVRGAAEPKGQRDVVEELWSHMEGRRFAFK